MRLSSWRVALRIARREARRTKGRSALVVAMVGLPMLALTFAAVTVRTAQLPPAEAARREIGTADLRATHVSDGHIFQTGVDGWSSDAFSSEPPDDTRTFRELLPEGSRAVPLRSAYGLRLRTADGGVALAAHQELPFGDPIAAGLVRLRAGRLPSAGDEIAVTPELRDQLGVAIGGHVDTVAVAGKGVSQRTLHVTGLAVLPQELGARSALSPTGSDVGAGIDGSAASWLVDLPAGVSDLEVMRRLNAVGYAVAPRTWFFHPPPAPQGVVDPAAVGVVVVAVGLATLEVVLLAGAAFAVGARRRRRELAVLTATGADRGDVVRVVLGGGVVLGVIAGVTGVLGGILLVVAARSHLDELNGRLLGPLDLRFLELAAIVAVAVGTAVLAAVLPARAAASASVVESLTGRRGQVRTARRVPAIGLGAIVAGSALAFWAAGSGIVQASASSSGPADPGRPARFNLLLAGAVVAELGFVLCAPAVVGLVGRAAGRLPLALRLALRDATRHRTRSGPAVAAVVAAVAGSVAVSVYLASDVDRQRRNYDPRLPHGIVEMVEIGYEGDRLEARDRAAAVAELPVAREVAVAQPGACGPGEPCDYWQAVVPPQAECPPSQDPKVQPRCRPFASGNGVVVADADFVELVRGRADASVAERMAGGAVIVFEPRLIDVEGQVTLTRDRYVDKTGKPLRRPDTVTVRLPAVAVDAPDFNQRPLAVVPPAVAAAKGIPGRRSATWLSTTRLPSDREINRARAAGGDASIDIYVERGFRQQNKLALLALLAASALVTVGATGIATGLAAADSRPDLATLAAVGAGPRVRRVLAMAQAATVAGLGSAMGVFAGLVPAVAVIAARAEFELAMPWAALAATVVGVPLLAALLVGAVSRSRLPMERRLA
jgi:putative ABC transport system permease protein